jgi:hypothetical protein
MPKRWLPRTLLGLALLWLLLQAVPYGRAHDNPPKRIEPRWHTPETRALAVRACFDCHSHATRWPWYSHVAPVSWLVQRDTDVGRRALNFSAWDRPQEEADDAAEVVRSEEMPPAIYLLVHPEARLSAAERATLAAGLAATVRGGGAAGGQAAQGDSAHGDGAADEDDEDEDDDEREAAGDER